LKKISRHATVAQVDPLACTASSTLKSHQYIVESKGRATFKSACACALTEML